MDPLILILVLLVFIALPLFQMRKQNQRLKEIRAFQEQLRPGMVVRMTSGLQGRIHNVGEKTIDLEIAPSVVTTWDRTAVLNPVDSVDTGSVQGDALQQSNPSTSSPVDQHEVDGPSTDDNPEGSPEDRR